MLNKKYFSILLFCIMSFTVFSQKDSISSNNKYWEDQLYFGLTYNVLTNQPSSVSDSEVSYGFSLGYIKDIPLNKKGTTAFGIGLGYNYDFFSHGLVVNSSDFSVNNAVTNNKMKTYNIEVPIQFRIRTSDAVTYSFWRVYFGARLSYNFFNKFQYTFEGEDFNITNVDTYNKFQTGLELSAGYGAFNFYAYYGITPIFDNAKLNGDDIETSILKLGLIFYLL